MKKLIFILLMFVGSFSAAQTPIKTFTVQKIYYYPTVTAKPYTVTGAETTINFVPPKIVTVISARITTTYLLGVERVVPQVDPQYYIAAYLCRAADAVDLPLLMSFIYYVDTSKLYALSVSDGVGLLVYEIYYKPNTEILPDGR